MLSRHFWITKKMKMGCNRVLKDGNFQSCLILETIRKIEVTAHCSISQLLIELVLLRFWFGIFQWVIPMALYSSSSQLNVWFVWWVMPYTLRSHVRIESFSSFQHGEMADESIQLKTLQTILIIFQSRLLPDDEVRLNSSFFITCLCSLSIYWADCFLQNYPNHWKISKLMWQLVL